MIVSASRRTDIPAHYSQWFFNRLKEGYVYVRNPMNFRQVSKVSLKRDDVDCFVFWTKYPDDFLNNIDKLSDYVYYFQFTLNSYPKAIEQNLKPESIIVDSFMQLSDIIGPERIMWRYDPIIFNDNLDITEHLTRFNRLCTLLSGYTNKCIFSFFDNYKSIRKNMMHLQLKAPAEQETLSLVSSMNTIAKEHKITLQSCAESYDMPDVSKARCIDIELISRLCNKTIKAANDKGQRKLCGCAKSIDIGAYSTCINKCLYCYATKNHNIAKQYHASHKPNSKTLSKEITSKDKVYIKQ